MTTMGGWLEERGSLTLSARGASLRPLLRDAQQGRPEVPEFAHWIWHQWPEKVRSGHKVKSIGRKRSPRPWCTDFPLPQPPPRRGVEVCVCGGGALAASRIERPRLFWESSFLPYLLQPPQPRSLESAGSSQ